MVVFGTGRFQNGILLSAGKPIEDKEKYLDDIWPAVEDLNQNIPSHSRIVRELVLVEADELPFALSDKGTVKKKVTLDMYAEIIDRAYVLAEQKGTSFLPMTFDEEGVSASLMQIVRSLLPKGTAIRADDDLFEHGKLLSALHILILNFDRNGFTSSNTAESFGS